MKNNIINIINEEIFNFDPNNKIRDKRELEDLERQEGGSLSFEQMASLTPWLWTNGEIKGKTTEHDNMESRKIPRLRNSSIDIFKEIIFGDIKIDKQDLFGFNEATKNLANAFRIDDTLSKIELGNLIKNKLRYNIVN